MAARSGYRIYRDRFDAGRQLGAALSQYAGRPDLIVLGLPRGGIPVAFQGILPDMFAEGREVVVEARYQDGSLAAKQIMTSCPSKYEAEPAS